MKDISCIFCGMPSDYIAINENGYTGRKCSDCNLIFISPRPNAEEVTHIYNDKHAVLYADAQFQFERHKRMVAASTLTKIRSYRKSGSILEIGPGGGFFLQEARNWGYVPYGIELNPIEARWITEKLCIPCENVALNAGSFEGKQFDIIYHSDVLSHLYDPISVFSAINRALKKDGLLVFETGNIADVDKKYYKYFSQFLYPDHLFFFGEHSLKLLLERTGFKYVSVYREAILLQLLLQKALWSVKDLLKDKQVMEDMKTRKRVASEGRGLSVKRRLRLLYRYVNYYLVRLGKILPKNGRPLKLLVVAKKESDLLSSL
jgi:SAM-dependent methyltransferase